jgi:hypothetical protein
LDFVLLHRNFKEINRLGWVSASALLIWVQFGLFKSKNAMTEEKKALTAGNVRLMIILGFVLALLALFQSQIKQSMSKGCFDLSLGYEDLGIKMSDKSYCTKDDLENLATDLVEAGAGSVRSQADSLAEIYEERINRLAMKNEEINERLNNELKYKNELSQQKKRFDRFMASKVNNPTTAVVARDINNVFQELFGALPSEPIVYQEIQVVTPEQVKIENAAIRSDFDVRSRTKVEKINESIRIKR